MMQHVLGDVVFKCRKKSRWYFSSIEIYVLDNWILSRPYSSLGFMYRFYKVTDTYGLTPFKPCNPALMREHAVFLTNCILSVISSALSLDFE